MRATSTRLGFGTAAAVVALTFWANAAPSMNYPLYAERWALAAWVPTAMYAVTSLTLVAVLLVFGNLSDSIGRRTSILAALGLVGVGAVVLALAPAVWAVFLGRVVTGIGVGLGLGPATAALTDFGGPDGARRSGRSASFATAAGLSAALVVGGALVQFAPAPMSLDEWVLVPVVAVVATFALRLPGRAPGARADPWRPRAPFVAAGRRAPFLGALFALAAGFAIGAIYIGLAADIVGSLVPSSAPFVASLVVAISPVAVGVTAALLRDAPPRRTLTLGLVTGAAGMSALVACGWTSSLTLLVASAVLTGVSNAALVSAGLGLVAIGAPARHRAAALSTAFLFAYLAQAATAVLLGVVTTASSFERAVELGLVIVVGLSLVATALVVADGRRARPGSPAPEPDTGAATEAEPAATFAGR